VVLVGKHELIYVDERAGRHRGALTDNVPVLERTVEAAAREPVEEAEEADDEDLEATGPR
jgi:hypothetical protein